MKISDYDFQLSDDLIARYPSEKRDESKLLVVDRKSESFTDAKFKDIINFIDAGDCLVLNDTSVFPARLYGKSSITGRKHEFLLLNYLGNREWTVLINKSKKCKIEENFLFDDNLEGKIIKKLLDGVNQVKFNDDLTLHKLERIAQMALPPYILKLREYTNNDKNTYQTVYHSSFKQTNELNEGSIAAPTAGLHFTNFLLEQLKKKG